MAGSSSYPKSRSTFGCECSFSHRLRSSASRAANSARSPPRTPSPLAGVPCPTPLGWFGGAGCRAATILIAARFPAYEPTYTTAPDAPWPRT
eukprot:scaffold4306_cov114-Isochrysis_galbana.AAC.6